MAPKVSGAAIATQPFSVAALRALLPAPRMPREDCSICVHLPGGVATQTKGGEIERDDVPPAAAKLGLFLRFGPHCERYWLAVCPECGRLYYREEGYEYFVNGSEEVDAYYPQTPEQVLALDEIRSCTKSPTEIRQYADGTWALFPATR